MKAMVFFSGLVILSLVTTVRPTVAQVNQDEQAYYIVQEGDTLWDIAARFGVGMEDLQSVNGITDPGQLSLGASLVIPGLDGYAGRLVTYLISYGETLHSLSLRFRLPLEILVRLNRLTSPAELYAGATLVIPYESKDNSIGLRAALAPGQSLLELAVLRDTTPWSIVTSNDLLGDWAALPGEILHIPGEAAEGPGALPEAITAITINPFPLSQGKTTVIKVSGQHGLRLSGSLAGDELHFFELEGGYVALQGIHAMTEPSLYSLKLRGAFPSRAVDESLPFTFSQPVLIRSSDYAFDPVLSVNPETLDPAVTQPEDDLWVDLGVPVTEEKMWEGLFRSPVPVEFKDCRTSLFGNRRSYNGSPYDYFHGGLDFCGGEGTELYAPAAGRVVFTGLLTVRGNATVIDHGWGVYTAYDHQSEILVKRDELVEAGQLIGRGGSTGRTTGPHLHWEVWVGGVQVDPSDWLVQTVP